MFGKITSKSKSGDMRMYVPKAEDWQAHLKQGWEKEYCYSKNPGEDYFHLLMNGEIYLQRGNEKYCLHCALRLGHITQDRHYWQHTAKTDNKKFI